MHVVFLKHQLSMLRSCLVLSELLFSVTMQAQREAPPDMQCRDKFLVQSAVVSQDISPKDINGDMVPHVILG
uniref:MSP domain-containing protein n=1 Tax=Aegilops tauschii subsp. strangulata TaxID=200361 RepID=A0A453P618_AEGTS